MNKTVEMGMLELSNSTMELAHTHTTMEILKYQAGGGWKCLVYTEKLTNMKSKKTKNKKQKNANHMLKMEEHWLHCQDVLGSHHQRKHGYFDQQEELEKNATILLLLKRRKKINIPVVAGSSFLALLIQLSSPPV